MGISIQEVIELLDEAKVAVSVGIDLLAPINTPDLNVQITNPSDEHSTLDDSEWWLFRHATGEYQSIGHDGIVAEIVRKPNEG